MYTYVCLYIHMCIYTHILCIHILYMRQLLKLPTTNLAQSAPTPPEAPVTRTPGSQPWRCHLLRSRPALRTQPCGGCCGRPAALACAQTLPLTTIAMISCRFLIFQMLGNLQKRWFWWMEVGLQVCKYYPLWALKYLYIYIYTYDLLWTIWSPR